MENQEIGTMVINEQQWSERTREVCQERWKREQENQKPRQMERGTQQYRQKVHER